MHGEQIFVEDPYRRNPLAILLILFILVVLILIGEPPTLFDSVVKWSVGLMLIAWQLDKFPPRKTILCHETGWTIRRKNIWGRASARKFLWDEITGTKIVLEAGKSGADGVFFVAALKDGRTVSVIRFDADEPKQFKRVLALFNEQTPHLPDVGLTPQMKRRAMEKASRYGNYTGRS